MPADLCLAIRNMPTRWNVIPLLENEFDGSRINGSGYQDDYREFIPEVDHDLLAEVRPKFPHNYIAGSQVSSRRGKE